MFLGNSLAGSLLCSYLDSCLNWYAPQTIEYVLMWGIWLEVKSFVHCLGGC